MSNPLLKGLGILLVSAGVAGLAASAYAMYKLGVSSPDGEGMTIAEKGIAAAVVGTASFLAGLWVLRLARGDTDSPPR